MAYKTCSVLFYIVECIETINIAQYHAMPRNCICAPHDRTQWLQEGKLWFAMSGLQFLIDGGRFSKMITKSIFLCVFFVHSQWQSAGWRCSIAPKESNQILIQNNQLPFEANKKILVPKTLRSMPTNTVRIEINT